jgi:hypothetical protein
VHANFAGSVSPTSKPAAFKVHDHHVRGLHHAFADCRRGAQDAILVEPHGKIPVRRSYIAAFVKHLSKANDFLPMLALSFHCWRIAGGNPRWLHGTALLCLRATTVLQKLADNGAGKGCEWSITGQPITEYNRE